MPNKPLYKDNHFRIDYDDKRSVDDHNLVIIDDKGEHDYLVPRGMFQNFAETDVFGLELMIATWNDRILQHIERLGISVESLHSVFRQAYDEQERRYQEFVRKRSRKAQ